MLKTIAVIAVMIIAVSLAAVLVIAATRPDNFRVARSTSIKAPPEAIFPLIEDFGTGAPGRPTRSGTPT